MSSPSRPHAARRRPTSRRPPGRASPVPGRDPIEPAEASGEPDPGDAGVRDAGLAGEQGVREAGEDERLDTESEPGRDASRSDAP